MKFSIVVYAAPYSAEAAATALNFTRALLEQGHDIYRLFFFGDGVHNASRLSVVAQDENNLQQQWDQLIRDHELDSIICVSSALNRVSFGSYHSTIQATSPWRFIGLYKQDKQRVRQDWRKYKYK